MAPSTPLASALRRAALLAALALASAAPAAAALRYVSPGGSDANSGATPLAPWSLGKANASAQPGDVVVLLPGIYSGDLNPSVSGTSAQRITYLGDPLAPEMVTVRDIVLRARSHITVRGVRASGNATLTANSSGASAAYDSLDRCMVDNQLVVTGAWACAVTNSRIGTGSPSSKWYMAPANEGTGSTAITSHCRFVNNVFDLGALAQPHANHFARFQHCEFTRNRVRMRIFAGANDVHGRVCYRIQHNRFTDNRWELVNEAGYASYVHNMRDSSSFNVFLRDTLVDLGPGTVRAWASNSGSFPGGVRGNRYESLVVRVQRGDSWYYQDGCRRDTLLGCTIVNDGGPAFVLRDVPLEGPVVVDHNTFAGRLANGAVAIEPSNSALGGLVRITNNVFYSLDHGADAQQGCHPMRSAAFVRLGLSPLQMDRNLYAFYGWVSSIGDRAVGYGFNCDPGTYPVGPSSPLCTSHARDCASIYGSPRFQDSTATLFDPRLRAGSAALGAGLAGTDMGATGHVSTGIDLVAPAAIADLEVLSVLDNALVLQWTAPGDDGPFGFATTYELRLATTPFDAGGFDGVPLATVQPVPAAGGSRQSFVVLGLAPATTYFLALRARDEAGNASPVSNVAAATTHAADQTAPGDVRDLGVSP